MTQRHYDRIFTSVLITLWVLLSFVNAGFIYADTYGRYPDLHSYRWNRETAGFCIGWSMTGVAWIITPFVTGFYYDGWKFPGSGSGDAP